MDTDLLNFFAERLEALHRKDVDEARTFEFNLDTFLERDYCGTVGCAVGWAVVDPALRDRFGLHSDAGEEPSFVEVARKIAAAANVPEDLFWYFQDIFHPRCGWSYWYLPGPEPTALDVATAIRRFAGGVDPADLVAFRKENAGRD